ncbi:hypothetical protein [Methylomonas rivi]|uniref:Secreted protein n=1 Tax=Methylomonas rivi TaxID=2952226 RepID=A0ABT1U410_9GAMM|nr:hypothetical protein [Methylomonas sp. WSC-6]MCQ8128578.1 hypothetical protein [Methylomonas sp. WSC-6]
MRHLIGFVVCVFLWLGAAPAKAALIHYDIVMQQENFFPTGGIRPLVGGFDIDSASLVPNSYYFLSKGELINFSVTGKGFYPHETATTYIYEPNLPMFVPGGQGATYPGPMVTTDANSHIVRLDGAFFNHSPSILSHLQMFNNQYTEFAQTGGGIGDGSVGISQGIYTLIPVTAVPIPAAIWLFACGLGLLTFTGREKRKRL